MFFAAVLAVAALTFQPLTSQPLPPCRQQPRVAGRTELVVMGRGRGGQGFRLELPGTSRQHRSWFRQKRIWRRSQPPPFGLPALGPGSMAAPSLGLAAVLAAVLAKFYPRRGRYDGLGRVQTVRFDRDNALEQERTRREAAVLLESLRAAGDATTGASIAARSEQRVREAALGVAASEFLDAPVRERVARLTELRTLKTALQPASTARALRMVASLTSSRYLGARAPAEAKEATVARLLLLCRALVDGFESEMEAAAIRTLCGFRGETALSERLLLSCTREVVLGEATRILGKATSRNAASPPTAAELDELRRALGALPALLGVPASALRPMLTRDLVPRLRAVLVAAVDEWVEGGGGGGGGVSGDAPVAPVAHASFERADAAADLVACVLEWGGGLNGGGGDALAELPAAGLTTLARHTFYGAYVRWFALSAVEASLESRGAAAAAEHPGGSRASHPQLLAKLLGAMPAQAKRNNAASYDAAVAAALRRGSADALSELAGQLQIGEVQAREAIETARARAVEEAVATAEAQARLGLE